jgi:predicted PilT family ATPase
MMPGMPGMWPGRPEGRRKKDKKKKKKKKRDSSSSSSGSLSDWHGKVWNQGNMGVWPGMQWPGMSVWPQGPQSPWQGQAGSSNPPNITADSAELNSHPAPEQIKDGPPENVPIFLEPAVEDVVPVPKTLLGKVIGKQAQTIIEIREKSGAFKVDARDQTTDPVMVKIAGTADAVRKARELILDLIDHTRSKHEGSQYVEIPRAKIGMVIGLKGAQVDEIQTQTGTKIDVDFNEDPCKCYIKGNPENVDRAKQVLLTIAMQIEDDNSKYMELPKNASGALIGAQGSRVREFQDLSGARIDVDKTGPTCRVRISGSRAQVAAAEALVLQEVAKVQSAIPDRPPPTTFPGFGAQQTIVPAHQPASMPATLSESIARARAAAMAVKSGLVTNTPAQVPPPPLVPPMPPPPAWR